MFLFNAIYTETLHTAQVSHKKNVSLKKLTYLTICLKPQFSTQKLLRTSDISTFKLSKNSC